MTGFDDILVQAAEWYAAGKSVALATVIDTWGSAPRPCGAQMAVTGSGLIAGSVSGGCIESAVVEAAQLVIATGTPQRLQYGVTNERAWEVGLTCGGNVTVFVERLG